MSTLVVIRVLCPWSGIFSADSIKLETRSFVLASTPFTFLITATKYLWKGVRSSDMDW